MSTVPTVYFIDDSATMREVIKIAFRRENINVVACHDAATALGQIEESRPDVVITDVIMPEKDGYEVCQYIKSHPNLGKTPVILMSGVVNRAVAERAFAVKADELLRKPFQPQDLITRVKHLLKPKAQPVATPINANSAAAALTSIFSAASAAQHAPHARPQMATSAGPQPVPAPAPRIIQTPAPAAASAAPVATAAPTPVAVSAPVSAPTPLGSSSQASGPIPMPASAHAHAKVAGNGDMAKMKIEILRLEGLVKKLQSELQAEREYSRALEEHVKTLQETE
jgi:CheY-like chemotaxis protein